MADIITVIILVCIIGAVVFYLYRAKKRGETCIGCPYSKQCGGNCSGSCHGNSNDKSAEDKEDK